MKGWKRSADGTWRLRSDGRSLSLPPSFDLDHSDEDVIGFTGITPANEIGWVAYDRNPVQMIIDNKFNVPDYKVLGVRTVAGLNITEIAPTTPSGRAKAKVRIYIVELASEASLVVIGGGDSFANSFAHQWAA